MATKIRFPTLDEIRTRAYQIYRAHGSQPGHDLDDWLQAEYELMQLPLHKIATLEATAVEGNNLKVFSLARLALTLRKESSKQVPPHQNRSAVSSKTGM